MAPVRKRATEDIRLTVNISRFNSKGKDVSFPMTNPTTLLGKVSGKPFVSTIDLASSFFKFKFRNTVRNTLPSGQVTNAYEFNRLPQGLPEVFSKTDDKSSARNSRICLFNSG